MSLTDHRAIRLDRQWDGSPAPTDARGAASLEIAGPDLLLSWDLRIREPLRMPSSPPGFLDGLWEHDVVELFLAPAHLLEGPPRYLELEAGAAGHWLALDLADVRVRRAELRGLAVHVCGGAVAASALRWQGRMRVSVSDITDVIGARPWRGLVAAVLGGGASERCYLTSSALPGERPNFHQPQGWVELVR